MTLPLDALKFMGALESEFEELTGAALPGNDAMPFRHKLYEEYVKGGSDRIKPWIKNWIKKVKLWSDTPPKWIEKIQATWPFCDGCPMTFIKQFKVPDNEVTQTQAVPGVQLFVFCCRRLHPSGNGWTSYYLVVEQHPDL